MSIVYNWRLDVFVKFDLNVTGNKRNPLDHEYVKSSNVITCLSYVFSCVITLVEIAKYPLKEYMKIYL